MVVVQLLLLMSSAQSGPSAVDWRWDKESAGCALRQQTTPSGEFIEVGVIPGSGGAVVTITNHGAGKIPGGTLKGGSVRFNPGENFDAQIFVSREPPGIRTIVAFTSDRDVLGKFSGSSTIQISHQKLGTIEAPVRSPVAAGDALIQCEDRKLREWGIDATAWRALKSIPIPLRPLHELLMTYDYPRLAAIYGVTGAVIVRLDVAPDGKVAACKALNPIRYKGFEESACNVLTKWARFQPAIGPDGNPAPAPHMVVVKFER